MRLLFCAFVVLIVLDAFFALGSVDLCFPRDGEEASYYQCLRDVHRANEALGPTVLASLLVGVATVVAGIRKLRQPPLELTQH